MARYRHGRHASRGGRGTNDFADALYFANRRLVRNLADLVLFLGDLVDVRGRRICDLHRAATNQRAAASAGTKFC